MRSAEFWHPTGWRRDTATAWGQLEGYMGGDLGGGNNPEPVSSAESSVREADLVFYGLPHLRPFPPVCFVVVPSVCASWSHLPDPSAYTSTVPCW